MKIEERCSKEEIINKLKKIGALPQLIKMPAVIERLYGARCNINELEVDSQGNIWYRNNVFKIGENETAKRFFTDKHIYDWDYESNMWKKRDDGVLKSHIPYSPNTRYTQKETLDRKKYSCNTEINKYGIESKTVGYGGEYIKRYKEDKKGYIYISGSILDPTILGYSTNRIVEDNADWSFANAKGELFTGEIYKLLNMGYLLKDYPGTEQWFVEIGLLPEEKEQRDTEIIKIMRITQEYYKNSLYKNQKCLKSIENRLLEINNRNDKREENDKNYYLREREEIKEVIENLNESIKKIDILCDIYTQGERPVDKESYTQEESLENRQKNFENKNNELENKIKVLSANLFKLQELAKRCEKIPFAGKKVSNVLNEQVTLLQEGVPENIESENDIDFLYNKYMNLKEIYERYKDAFLNLKNNVMKCAKIPFIGRGLLKEMNEMLENQNSIDNLEQR